MASIEQCIHALQQQTVIAYPTEAVFGLGCDPDSPTAIKSLLAIKQRDKAKGLILVAASVAQLEDYIDLDKLSDDAKTKVMRSWPGAVTWILPAGKKATSWLTGGFDSIAVRVSAHPDVISLCTAFGKPLTSTSANLSGLSPCRSAIEVAAQLGSRIDCILHGKVGEHDKPTEIRDARSGEVRRKG